VASSAVGVEIMAPSGMEEMNNQFKVCSKLSIVRSKGKYRKASLFK